MENQTLSPYTGAPRTSPRPLQAPFNRTTRFGIAISYFKTVANEYDWLKWSQLEETHGRKLHIVLVDESLRWYVTNSLWVLLIRGNPGGAFYHTMTHHYDSSL